MSEFRGSVPDQLPSFLYRLRDESSLAGSNRGDQLSFSESKQNSTVAKRMIPLSVLVLRDEVQAQESIVETRYWISSLEACL
jgi:hypothetical protein